MWRNPNYPPTAEAERPHQHRAPAETGQRLATFPRDKKGSGDQEELRLEISEFQGHKFVSLRLWFRSPQDGRFYPTKKGISLRRVELEDAIEALKAAARIIGDSAPPPRREQRGPQARASSSTVTFDEFDGS